MILRNIGDYFFALTVNSCKPMMNMIDRKYKHTQKVNMFRCPQ